MYAKKESTIQPRELLKKMLLTSERAIYEEIETVEQKVDSLSHKMDGLGESLKKKSEEELLYEINPDDIRGEQGEPGKDYLLTESDKREIALKVKVPVVEKTIEIQKTEIIREQPTITEIIKQIENPETPENIRNKLELLHGDERLDKSAIKGLEDLGKGKTNVLGGLAGLRVYVGGAKKGLLKELNFKAGTGVTLAHSIVNGLDTITFTASSALGTTWHNETPTGTIDGSNKTFTLSATPATNSLEFLWNGIRQSALAGDYSLSGATITMLTTVAPQVGDILEAKYTT